MGEAHKIEGLEDLNKDHVPRLIVQLSVFGVYKPPFADFFYRPLSLLSSAGYSGLPVIGTSHE